MTKRAYQANSLSLTHLDDHRIGGYVPILKRDAVELHFHHMELPPFTPDELRVLSGLLEPDRGVCSLRPAVVAEDLQLDQIEAMSLKCFLHHQLGCFRPVSPTPALFFPDHDPEIGSAERIAREIG